MDLKSYSRWYDYSRARDDMFAATDTAFAPWYVARTDDKRRGRLNIITHPRADPVQEVAAREDRAAQARKPGDYREPDYPLPLHLRTVLRRGTMAESTGFDSEFAALATTGRRPPVLEWVRNYQAAWLAPTSSRA